MYINIDSLTFLLWFCALTYIEIAVRETKEYRRTNDKIKAPNTITAIQDTVAAFTIVKTTITASRKQKMCANVTRRVYTSTELNGN